VAGGAGIEGAPDGLGRGGRAGVIVAAGEGVTEPTGNGAGPVETQAVRRAMRVADNMLQGIANFIMVPFIHSTLVLKGSEGKRM